MKRPAFLSYEQSAGRIWKRLNPRSSPLVTIACIIGALFGVLLHLQLPRLVDFGLGENFFALFAALGMGLIFFGFVPEFSKWRLGRLATIVSSTTIGCYLIYTLWIVFSHQSS